MHETVGRSQPVTVGLLRTLPTVRIGRGAEARVYHLPTGAGGCGWDVRESVGATWRLACPVGTPTRRSWQSCMFRRLSDPHPPDIYSCSYFAAAAASKGCQRLVRGRGAASGLLRVLRALSRRVVVCATSTPRPRPSSPPTVCLFVCRLSVRRAALPLPALLTSLSSAPAAGADACNSVPRLLPQPLHVCCLQRGFALHPLSCFSFVCPVLLAAAAAAAVVVVAAAAQRRQTWDCCAMAHP